jgi:hypothetical protein
MAIYAKLHVDRNMRPGKRESHFGDVPMTRLASDFSDRHVSTVGKVGMIGHPVNLNPRDGLIFPDIVHQLLLLVALRHGLFMAVLANPDVRNRRLFMGKNPGVAVEAIQAGILEMFLVIV